MDWLDRINIAAIVIISLLTVGMVANHEYMSSDRNDVKKNDVVVEKAKSYNLQIEKEKAIYKDVVTLKEQKSYTEALAKLEEIKKSRPGLSRTYVHLAQIDVAMGNLVDAMHNYRKAIELEPDYVDHKSPLAIGKEIKKVVAEGKSTFEKAVSKNPGDNSVRQGLKDVYYLQRRLAGGCE